MIRGIVSLSSFLSSEISNVVCVLSDADQLLMPRKRKLCELEDTIKHTYSNDSKVGVLMADIDEQFIFISHSDCVGINCFCRVLAVEYLSGIKPLSLNSFGSIAFPCISVFSFESCTHFVRKYSDTDVCIEELNDGNYFIRYILC